MLGIVSKHQKINSKRNIAEDDAHVVMHIKILLRFYFYDMHVVSGKCKRLFQHMAHAPLQNKTSRMGNLRLAMQCHSQLIDQRLKKC